VKGYCGSFFGYRNMQLTAIGGQKPWGRACIIVRSRSVFNNIGTGLQTIVGGNITLYSDLCEKPPGCLILIRMEQIQNAVLTFKYRPSFQYYRSAKGTLLIVEKLVTTLF
jgi:hypothetical protein